MLSEQLVICSIVLLFCTALIHPDLRFFLLKKAKQKNPHGLLSFAFPFSFQRIAAFSTLFLALFSGVANAQLSPGDLSKAHAHLEGLSNCTKCHVLGDKVSNAKCLDCHKEIKSRIDTRSGFHASREIKGKDCTDCHSDHHGRNFDMVRFDKNKFNHDLAGFKLTGAHQRIDCRQCHKPDFVDDRELKKRTDTYLGLNTDCIACHEDYHQKTLSSDCAKCHTTTAFAPASKFDHSKADFPLRGQHKLVDCKSCHKDEVRNGKVFKQFTGLSFSNCNSCHNDPHNFNLGTNCKQCHTEQSFLSTAGLKNFDHSETHFPLKGKHEQVDCAGCHNMRTTASTIFQDRLGVRTNNCVQCHQDVHDRKFGTNCAECHDERSFRVSGTLKNFNHARTGFELVGKHQTVGCKQCHTSGSFTKPMRYYFCADCHTDYHEGQMASILGISPDCRECHTEAGFETSQFGIDDHAKAKLPLDGGHAATPCFACHKPDNEKKWQFRNIGETCVDCHNDVHVGFLDKKYYPDQDCKRCHVTASWDENHFDHKQTAFKLQGAHAKQACMACHGKDDGGKLPERFQQFAGTPTTCAACHDNVHGDQFDQNGQTDCLRCHAFDSWAIKRFNHNKTAFKLDGKHASVACSKCHKPVEENGKLVVQYQLKSFQCIDCHL
ncbi:MAG: cytochrome c family protein [Lewinellaceae bacterium]|nr:cytochrome c family protein [Lewinellaceae bacterium]